MLYNSLYIRLHNCLQTILDLEPSLANLDFSGNQELKKLFAALKDSLSKLDDVEYEREDVERIEQAVSFFLQEITLICRKTDKALYSGRILH